MGRWSFDGVTGWRGPDGVWVFFFSHFSFFGLNIATCRQNVSTIAWTGSLQTDLLIQWAEMSHFFGTLPSNRVPCAGWSFDLNHHWGTGGTEHRSKTRSNPSFTIQIYDQKKLRWKYLKTVFFSFSTNHLIIFSLAETSCNLNDIKLLDFLLWLLLFNSFSAWRWRMWPDSKGRNIAFTPNSRAPRIWLNGSASGKINTGNKWWNW